MSKLLLAKGADINIASAGGRTPIMGVAMNGHVDLLKMFLDAGADLTPKNDFDETALDLAKVKGHVDVAEILSAKILCL